MFYTIHIRDNTLVLSYFNDLFGCGQCRWFTEREISSVWLYLDSSLVEYILL